MTAKQSVGRYAPDGAKYGTLTDGANVLDVTGTASLGTTKQSKGSQAPDGSIYFTLTNGSGTLV